ncbi:putative oxidoreductase [Parvularcula bermudensis HTCC2503]|uniref:Putative oxidoreductase n=1 Tax=Parvularcula bermudensis (strain ATCC BAA-594 / HTCC2503 / KCTC 12087) TaxID=314260 RepID=E0TBB3_PARBH|nr:SDR family NAD(P)-dependent oxidoreductase [Parvularcula bermudensis]ADM08317.1 putative oxidoreductase [Parvularcula bermudensis HTCC2503]
MLEGKSVVITGAGGALGRAAVKAVEANGGWPFLVDRTLTELSDRERMAELDVTDDAAVAALAARVETVDAVFAIAGGFDMGERLSDPASDRWDAMMRANVDTCRVVMRHFLPRLRERGGAFVTVGAYAALSGQAEMGAYIAAKSVVMRMTETAAAEERLHGVNVNAVLPTIIDTPGNRAAMPDADWGKWVSPDRLARTMCFLASEAAADIHGALLPVRALS